MSPASRPRKPQIPLTLLTGALGAGKTTLLNRLLRDDRFAGSAVIVNEVGEVAIDGGPVVERADEGIVALSGGCVCCTVRGELVDALERLLRALDNGRIARMERVLIETAGLADPAPILYLLARHPYLSLRFRLDGIVAVVDAVSGMTALDAHEETAKQVAAADRIVLTKGGLATDGAASLRARLRRLNPAAPILDAGKSEHLPVMLIGAFDPPPGDDAGVLAWLAADAFGGDGRAERGFSAFAVFRDGAMTATALYEFLDRLVLEHGSKLVRFKGIVGDAGMPDRPALIQGVAGLFSPPLGVGHWPDSDRRSRLTAIVRDLDREVVERLFDAFLGGRTDTPDRDAILANPLAIPGFRAR